MSSRAAATLPMFLPRRCPTWSRTWPRRGVGVGALDGFDRGPAHQPAALFGDPPAVHRGIGLVVFRGQPGPAGQLRCPAEAMHITDLGDEHRTQDRPTPEMVWIAV
jgi:hypothetical protein